VVVAQWRLRGQPRRKQRRPASGEVRALTVRGLACTIPGFVASSIVNAADGERPGPSAVNLVATLVAYYGVLILIRAAVLSYRALRPTPEEAPAGADPVAAADSRSFRAAVRNGFRLIGLSSRVVRDEPTIGVVAFAGFLSSLAIDALVFAAVFRRWPEAADFRIPRLFALLAMFGLGAVAANCGGVVACVLADARLHGRAASVGDGLAVVRSRFGLILRWTLVSTGVGAVLATVAERLKLLGFISSRILGLSWVLATTFVVPAIALERSETVNGAISSSATAFRQRWGTSVAGYGGMAAALVIVLVPLEIVAGIVMALDLVAGIVLAAVLFVALMAATSGLGTVLNTALYRFATEGDALGPFPAAELEAMYRPRTRRPAWRRRGRR
jgi:hypothetical protein